MPIDSDLLNLSQVHFWIFSFSNSFPGSNPNEFGIVSAHEPRRMTKPPTPCLVAGWKVKSKDDMYRLAEPVVVRELAQKVSSMTVSDDGKLIGLGCSDGSVDVFSSCGMELVLR